MDHPEQDKKEGEEMQDDAEKKKCPDCGAEVAMVELKEARVLLSDLTKKNLELVAANENLQSDVEKFKSPKAIQELQIKLKQQDRQLLAEKVRRLVKSGSDAGQFDRALVGDPDSGYNHPSDEQVLAWFKSSTFKGDLERLEIMLEVMPKKKLGRKFPGAGSGSGEIETAMTDSDKEYIRRLGHDPEAVTAANKAKDATDYAALLKAAK